MLKKFLISIVILLVTVAKGAIVLAQHTLAETNTTNAKWTAINFIRLDPNVMLAALIITLIGGGYIILERRRESKNTRKYLD